MRLTIAVAALLLSSPVNAACLSLPDDADSNYVENRTALALCQQRELDLATQQAARDSELKAQLGNLQIQIDRQRIQQQQMLTQIQPKWPEI